MTVLVGLLFLHLIGDFFLQSDRVGIGKSHRWAILAEHVAIYLVPFALAAVGLSLLRSQPLAGATLAFLALTGALHFLTDAVTSRITSRLWFFKREDGIWAQAAYAAPKHDRTLVNPWTPIEDGRRHWFFVVIGVDQFLHIVALAAVAVWTGVGTW